MIGVVNCRCMNIRDLPGALGEVIISVPLNTELEIDMSESTGAWYYVCTASGIEGYCLKMYIDLKK